MGVNSSTSHGRYLTILSVYFSSKKAPLPILKCFPFIFGSHRDGIYNTLIKYNGKTRIWFGKRHDTESKFRKGEKKKKSEEAMPDEVFRLRYIFQLEVEDST